MDPEIKKLLEENVRIAQDTNDMLRSMRRTARWGFVGKLVFWALLFVAPLIFVWGYIKPLLETVQGVQEASSGFNIENLQKLLEQY